jgi:hypothetical protein
LASSVSSTLDVADGNNRKNPMWQAKACFGRMMSKCPFMESMLQTKIRDPAA